MSSSLTLIIVTGGIGSGKSFILNYIENLGFCVLYTDPIAKEVMVKKAFLKEIQEFLKLKDEVKLWQIKDLIQKDLTLIDFIEYLVHPEVQRIRDERIKQAALTNNFIFIEAPLFFEKNLRPVFEKHGKTIVLSTVCGINKQVERVKKRNKNFPDKMLQMVLLRQYSDNIRVASSDLVVYTGKSKYKVKKIVKKFLKDLQKKNE